jgi:hypothetical protein
VDKAGCHFHGDDATGGSRRKLAMYIIQKNKGCQFFQNMKVGLISGPDSVESESILMNIMKTRQQKTRALAFLFDAY